MPLEVSKQVEDAVRDHLASGKYASSDELILRALDQLTHAEREDALVLDELRESLADEEAGRMRPIGQIAIEIAERHGFGSPE